jgi:hypothetical protein
MKRTPPFLAERETAATVCFINAIYVEARSDV